jgi:hypothetical protein
MGKGFRASFASLDCIFPGKRMFCSGHGKSEIALDPAEAIMG